ncbi:MAG TPA: hypothetical protein PLW66_02850 [Saprospiraceae bacterium]|nr:hypothetical protein [Saprospiraceae bacterium]
MAEPLKNLLSRSLLESFAAEMKAVHPSFPTQDFIKNVFSGIWDGLELKQRIRHISHSLRNNLPAEYAEALALLVKTTQNKIDREGEQLNFWYSFLPDFVETYGVEHPDESLPALETITRLSSAEFAIRPFLLRYPERLYAQMLVWSRHPSPMVRRLSSEGFRPRLPWGMGVPALKRDPAPILPVLENLRDDPAETVRRSVANNLNDIAKDHPELVLDIAQRWYGQSPQTDWVVRHACRGLLKKGHPAALAHFGFEQGITGVSVDSLQLTGPVAIGSALDFSFVVKNDNPDTVTLRIEYGIDYLTGTGKVSSKVFKIKEMVMPAGASESIARRQRFTDFTTRKHYPGLHRLRILVNGMALTEQTFQVV